MKVTVEVLGPLRRKPDPNPIELEADAPSRILDLMVGPLAYTEAEAKHLVYLRNGKMVKVFSPVVDGDRIEAVLHVGGG